MPQTLTLILFLSLIVSYAGSRSGRIFKPTPEFTKAEDLPGDFTGIADSLLFQRYDAFDGSVSHTPMDEKMFVIGNKLHIDSKEKTIQKRLLFRRGEIVNREILIESERRLRQEEFLADAIIEVSPKVNKGVILIITTYDQWTTTPAVSLTRTGGEWEYYFGPVESNLLGQGQKLGFIYEHTIDRNYYWAQYSNKAFLTNRLQLTGMAGKSSDGFHHQFILSRPLFSKQDRWGFEINGKATKTTKYYYLDADDTGEARRLLPEDRSNDRLNIRKDNYNILFYWPKIVDLDFASSLTRSFGRKSKFNFSLQFLNNERYSDVGGKVRQGGLFTPSGYRFQTLPDYLALDFRTDRLLGLYLSFYRYDFKTVKNFRNLKWNEDIDVGFKVANGIFQNLAFAGAKNTDLYLIHRLTYNNVWQSRHFLNTGATASYFLGYSGRFEDGYFFHGLEYQWKPVTITSTFFQSSWVNYFAREKTAQLLLGEWEGLNGYPNRFFTGQAKLLLQLEQRLFPRFEIGTSVPALALFLNAGNVYPSYGDFEWNELHYSAGVGLRLGLSRSTKKVVNHLNIAMPLDPKYRKDLKLTFSIVNRGNL